VTGTGFGTSGTLTVGGAEATVTDWSDTRIEATVPAGAGDAWQEVVVTNEVGTSSVDGFFVGVEFEGTAAELQGFLDGLELGSSVLLAADDYDLSASTEPFVVDNKSLYGRGSDQ